jgi:hypothetical protein
MMDRRKLLIGTGAAATYAFSASILPSRDAAASGRPELVSENEETEQLLYELARLEARYYTEEGVAMLRPAMNMNTIATASMRGELK